MGVCERALMGLDSEAPSACVTINLNNVCAMTCDFQQCGILTSIDSDEPLQPPFRHRNSKIW